MAAPTGSVQLTEVLVKYSLPLMVNKRCLKLLSDIDTRAEPDKLTPTFDLSFPYILQGSKVHDFDAILTPSPFCQHCYELQ